MNFALFRTLLMMGLFLLVSCIKFPAIKPNGKGEGDTPSTNPSPIEYVYPFAAEPSSFVAEVTLTLAEGVDPAELKAEIPPLKYNKSLLVMLTQDDCKQAAFSTTWAAINGRLLSDTYYYNALHMRLGDLPPDLYSLGKTLASTDGTGRDVRFSFTTTLSPEWAYMDSKAEVKPGYISNFYRFYRKEGLQWDDVREMVNYGVSVALHDLNSVSLDRADSLITHFEIAQQITLDRLNGRGVKVAVEPDGNKVFTDAAKLYDPIRTLVLQSGGVELFPFEVDNDLAKVALQRVFSDPRSLPSIIDAEMMRPAEVRRAINIGVHGTDRKWVDFLLWLHNHYGRGGEDVVWMPSVEEYYEYNHLRHHAVVTKHIEAGKVRFRIEIPGELYFYYPSLTLNIAGVTPGQCVAIEAGDQVAGFSHGVHAGGVMVNMDCRHALVAHVEHFVQLYEASPSPANRADARYFVAMLRDSETKTQLLERVK